MEVASVAGGGSDGCLETLKVLHETVLALRTALEASKEEVHRLRNRLPAAPRKSRRHLLPPDSMDSPGNAPDPLDQSPHHDNKPTDSGAESDDFDDIELVFTTGEPDPRSLHEDLVPILEETDRKYPPEDLVETDISRCGVPDDPEIAPLPRRNTLPDPLPYRPILHREILAASRPTQPRSPRKPLLPPTHETAAQTDITALPAHWKSESHLAHKINPNLTTLPSKFTLPAPQRKRLPLADKTREARRVLLSDIDFTSKVPELSRSADHLHEEKTAAEARTPFDSESPPSADKCCECLRHDSRSTYGSFCGSRCHVSSTSIHPFPCEDPRRRHSWRTPHLPCCHATHLWSSVPSSPAKCLHHSDVNASEECCCCRSHSRRRRKVRFLHCDPFGRSLPNLRAEGDSGDSTDSLLEESEEFLRRSIDSMRITRRRDGRSSEFVSGFERPKLGRPFLPKSPLELEEGCHVKVITPGGRIVVGRVRYAGDVPTEAEPYVGVELSSDTGFSDGAFMGHRFFECDTNHAVFVPFGKVVMAWRA